MRVVGRHYLTGQMIEIQVERVIRSMTPVAESSPAAEVWLAPGLVDIQVNGYHGYSFLTPDDVVACTEALAEAGVTGFCPTIVTASPEDTAAQVRAIRRACEMSLAARERILAIHLEGPYICGLDGPRGAHPWQHVRNPDWDEFSRLQEEAGGRIGIITLAPELPGAVEFIARARQAGVVVGLGHHAAERRQIQAAVDAGALLSTHLGNGAHAELRRHHNYIWEQLAHDGLMASVIVDGHHLPPSVVKCFYRIKGPSHLILVSDAMPAAGLPAGSYSFLGMMVETVGDGSVRLPGTPYLAGSTLRLCDAVGNVMAFAGASFADAVTMATTIPAQLLNVADERGKLLVGARGDITVFRFVGGRPVLVQTIIGGKVCYEV